MTSLGKTFLNIQTILVPLYITSQEPIILRIVIRRYVCLVSCLLDSNFHEGRSVTCLARDLSPAQAGTQKGLRVEMMNQCVRCWRLGMGHRKQLVPRCHTDGETDIRRDTRTYLSKVTRLQEKDSGRNKNP